MMVNSGLMSKEEVYQRWLENPSRILTVDPDNGVVASYDVWHLALSVPSELTDARLDRNGALIPSF